MSKNSPAEKWTNCLVVNSKLNRLSAFTLTFCYTNKSKLNPLDFSRFKTSFSVVWRLYLGLTNTCNNHIAKSNMKCLTCFPTFSKTLLLLGILLQSYCKTNTTLGTFSTTNLYLVNNDYIYTKWNVMPVIIDRNGVKQIEST